MHRSNALISPQQTSPLSGSILRRRAFRPDPGRDRSSGNGVDARQKSSLKQVF